MKDSNKDERMRHEGYNRKVLTHHKRCIIVKE